ncbi:MAG: RdgB/HAM1 family non-canonical purine NTP pyrophosphatase [Candidatus Solibacter usitatus]|nr:RdgB/HAM1 family non-canonical purine NTP pyrophosphatase [Candidatus Solibacter usitatus]
MKLYCATTNPGKVREFEHAAGELFPGEFEFALLPDFRRIHPPRETGGTFAENAALKAAYYSRHVAGLVFADDSGLAVDALGGEPGVHSARFSGDGATDESNNRMLLEKLEDEDNRNARYVCVIALATEGRLLGTFEGHVEGEILREARGDGGFGYDPYFLYPPFGLTFGEATKEQKLRVSHRGHALRAMLEFLKATKHAQAGVHSSQASG